MIGGFTQDPEEVRDFLRRCVESRGEGDPYPEAHAEHGYRAAVLANAWQAVADAAVSNANAVRAYLPPRYSAADLTDLVAATEPLRLDVHQAAVDKRRAEDWRARA